MKILRSEYLKTLNQNELLNLFFLNMNDFFKFDYSKLDQKKDQTKGELEYNNLLENIEIIYNRILKIRK